MKPLALVLTSLTIALLMWGYNWHRNSLLQERLDLLGFPSRNTSDLYPRWLGTKELLDHHRDPYSSDITSEIQRGYYGRPIGQSPTDPIDEQRFAYPLYVVLILAPSIYLPFATVQWLFAILLFAMALWTIFLWIRFLGIKLSRSLEISCALIIVATIPFAEGVQLQQFSVLVSFLIACAVWLVTRRRIISAGFLLALASIKPQLAFPIIAFFLIWSLSRWRLHSQLVVSLLLSLATLLGVSGTLLPRWPIEFAMGVVPYLRYTQATTGLQALLPRFGGLILIIFGVIAALAVWLAKEEPADSDRFRLAVSLVLCFTCAAVPSLAPHNEVLLVPAFLLLAKERALIRKAGRLARALWFSTWASLAWSIVTGCLLMIARFAGASSWLKRLWDLPLATNPLIPIATFVTLIVLVFMQNSDLITSLRAAGSTEHPQPVLPEK